MYFKIKASAIIKSKNVFSGVMTVLINKESGNTKKDIENIVTKAITEMLELDEKQRKHLFIQVHSRKLWN